tara:strand:- start:281 stop:439 length:159 start_codon:yes stop_codon:yes gene_type:complete
LSGKVKGSFLIRVVLEMLHGLMNDFEFNKEEINKQAVDNEIVDRGISRSLCN